jgi:hypothetical protein
LGSAKKPGRAAADNDHIVFHRLIIDASSSYNNLAG